MPAKKYYCLFIRCLKKRLIDKNKNVKIKPASAKVATIKTATLSNIKTCLAGIPTITIKPYIMANNAPKPSSNVFTRWLFLLLKKRFI